MAEKPRTCAVTDCTRPVKARWLCQAHHRRVSRSKLWPEGWPSGAKDAKETPNRALIEAMDRAVYVVGAGKPTAEADGGALAEVTRERDDLRATLDDLSAETRAMITQRDEARGLVLRSDEHAAAANTERAALLERIDDLLSRVSGSDKMIAALRGERDRARVEQEQADALAKAANKFRVERDEARAELAALRARKDAAPAAAEECLDRAVNGLDLMRGSLDDMGRALDDEGVVWSMLARQVGRIARSLRDARTAGRKAAGEVSRG